MDSSKSRIRPFSMVTAVLVIILSAVWMFMLLKGRYINSTFIFIIAGVLLALNLICLIIALKANRKWFQYLVSVLLIIICGAGIFADITVSKVVDSVAKVLTVVPEKTAHSTYLINHTYYMIIDDVDNHTVKTSMLEQYNTCDIEAFLDGLKARNTDVQVRTFPSPLEMFASWHTFVNKTDHDSMSLVLPEEIVELAGDFWNTDRFLAGARVKYQYDEEISTGLNADGKPDIRKEPFTVLISGNDARGIKTDDDFLNRSDTNMLLTVNPKTRKIVYTILPYDLLVDLDGNTERKDRLTDASFYGVGTWKKAVEDALDIRIDYFIRFNYSGFADLIDHLGGITIYNSEFFNTFTEIRTDDGWEERFDSFSRGSNDMDGNRALIYVRESDRLLNGYDNRWENFKAIYSGIIEELKEKISDKNISVNGFSDIIDLYNNRGEYLGEVNGLIDVLEGSVATDMDHRDLLNYLISEGMLYNKWTVETQRLTATYDKYPLYSANGYPLSAGVIAPEDLQKAVSKIQNTIGQ